MCEHILATPLENRLLSIPYRPGTPTYKLQVKTSSSACITTLPRALWLRTSPSCWDGLRRCHVSYGSGLRLPTEVGSGVATCPTALDLASTLRWAPMLPHVLMPRTSPFGWGGLWRCHVPRDFGPHLHAEVGSGATTCPKAPDLASRLRWTPALPCVIWLWTSPPGWGGLWCCHVSYSSGSRLPTEVGSSAAMCHMALDFASRLRRAPTLPHALWLRTSPPDWGGLRRCHMSRGSLWATGLKHKEKPSSPTCAARHACSQCTCARFQVT
jgi:hypothetical protein